jgi:predicted GNAT family N-acyltransferase
MTIREDEFTVEIASFDLDFEALRAVREPVFVIEQGVPREIEADALDAQCRHVLARDAEGTPIGTGRLTPQRTIGRLAVLPEWRGRGVGAALLQALIDLARAHGHPVVELHAQVDAIGFYENFAFEVVGPEYLEAGIRHRTMRRTLDPFPEVTRAALAPRPETHEIAIDSLGQAQDVALQILRQPRKQLWIYSRDLDPLLFGTPEALEAIKQFAITSRGGRLRIVLQEPLVPLREKHPLIPLMQRLSSCIAVRVPHEEADLQYPAAFLIDDRGGYLLRPIGSRFEGTANLHAPGRQRQLREYFEQVWERSLPSPELRPLHI